MQVDTFSESPEIPYQGTAARVRHRTYTYPIQAKDHKKSILCGKDGCGACACVSVSACMHACVCNVHLTLYTDCWCELNKVHLLHSYY